MFSTYDDIDPIINFTKLTTHNASMTCHSHHLCYSHQVDIAWYLNISSLQEPLEYFAGDSELAYSEYGMSIQSTCPDYECQSTLTIPNDNILNNTVIWCGGYIEICPKTKQSISNPVTVITNSCTSGMSIDLLTGIPWEHKGVEIELNYDYHTTRGNNSLDPLHLLN